MVINTEAHVFPRFELGRLFETGWKRKERAGDGSVIGGEGKTNSAGGDGGGAAGDVVKVRRVVRAEAEAEGGELEA